MRDGVCGAARIFSLLSRINASINFGLMWAESTRTRANVRAPLWRIIFKYFTALVLLCTASARIYERGFKK